MPISPNTPTGPKVDVNLREHLSFNPASQETIQRTNLAKSFLEDYYKQMPTRATTKIEEEPPPAEIDKSKQIKKSSSNKKIKETKSASPQITRPFSVMHHAHVGFGKGTGLQVQNLPNELREFVEDLNASLGHHGAENITEEELKMVLASAKLPTSASAPTPLSSQPALPRNDEEVIDIHEKIDSNMNSIIDTFTPPSSPVRSPSAPSVPATPLSSSSSSVPSSSSSTPTATPTSSSTSTPSSSQQTPQKKIPPAHPPPPYPDPVTPPTPSAQANITRDNMSVNVGKDTEKGKDKEKEKEKEREREKDNKAQSSNTDRARSASRTRKFTQFFTGRPSNEPSPGKRLSRSLSEASAKPKAETASAQSPAAPARGGFERATPKAAKAANFEISSPRNFAKVGGFDFGGESMKDMKVKLELADKALQNENQLRLAAEEKTAGLEKQPRT